MTESHQSISRIKFQSTNEHKGGWPEKVNEAEFAIIKIPADEFFPSLLYWTGAYWKLVGQST